MIANYTEPQWKEEVTFELAYDDGHGNGFGFPCDEHGNLPPDLNPDAAANLAWCREHPERFARSGKVLRRVYSYREPAHGTCSCGETVMLTNEYCGACECPNCGKWYNLFGQELEPPERWDKDELDYEY